MRISTDLVIIVCVVALMCGGCAHFSVDPGAFTGIGMKDLEKARSDGRQKILALSYDAAFDKVKQVLNKNSLTIYRMDRKKGYMVAMGFPKQTDTTRVGIFFDSLDNDRTRVTLSSLSSSALAKADIMIFGQLDTDVIE